MTDLENAIYYSLTQEIGVVKYITEEKFSVLKSYLSVLKDHFPGSPHVIGFLSELHKWVSAKTDNITGEEFVHAMDDLKGSEIYLPKMHEWVGCKGSEPRYRGYPCSLWTLFHTLTIQAENMFEDARGYMKKRGTNVLFTIRDYVKHFFTCEECSQNFAKMAENLEDEVSTAREAALWLWNAHNRVNGRLAGDVTEDPKYPKVQFPTKEMCGKCRIEEDESGNIQWDKALVLRYLQHFYGKDNIINSQVPQVKEALSIDQIAGLENSSMGLKFTLCPVSTLLPVLLYVIMYFLDP
ncbi:Sulfhydryl oxidase 1, partial [Stegodyphus mimosarum]